MHIYYKSPIMLLACISTVFIQSIYGMDNQLQPFYTSTCQANNTQQYDTPLPCMSWQPTIVLDDSFLAVSVQTPSTQPLDQNQLLNNIVDVDLQCRYKINALDRKLFQIFLSQKLKHPYSAQLISTMHAQLTSLKTEHCKLEKSMNCVEPAYITHQLLSIRKMFHTRTQKIDEFSQKITALYQQHQQSNQAPNNVNVHTISVPSSSCTISEDDAANVLVCLKQSLPNNDSACKKAVQTTRGIKKSRTKK